MSFVGYSDHNIREMFINDYLKWVCGRKHFLQVLGIIKYYKIRLLQGSITTDHSILAFSIPHFSNSNDSSCASSGMKSMAEPLNFLNFLNECSGANSFFQR